MRRPLLLLAAVQGVTQGISAFVTGILVGVGVPFQGMLFQMFEVGAWLGLICTRVTTGVQWMPHPSSRV